MTASIKIICFLFKLFGCGGLDPKVIVVTFQKLKELESSGEEIRQDKEKENKNRACDTDSRECVYIWEELVASDIHYCIHRHCHKSTT